MNVHLVDGTYELFRAYYGAPKRTNAEGREIGAARGLLRTLVALLREPGVSHVGVAFDHVVESFRNEMFDGYKTGEGIEPELASQFELAERVASALGVTVWPMVEFEADDAIASAAHQLTGIDSIARIFLCSPDKDLAQCVVGDRVVMLDRKKNTTLDADGVREKFGVPPASIPDWLGLVGDAADGIPGIPRWGAKSAATVLAHYGHIDAIPPDPQTWAVKVRGAAGLSERLEAARDEASLYRRLAVLRVDVPLAEGRALRPSDLLWSGPDLESLRAVAAEVEDPSIVARVLALAEERRA